MENKHYSLKLVVACVMVFILQLVIKGFTEYFVLDQSSYIQIWRFLSAIFLHGGLSHILYNMFALALFGFMLESLIGSKRFLLVFFSTGIIANLIAVNFYESSLGASGAIFGIIGALIMIRPTLMVFAFGVPMPIFIAGILWVIGDIVGVFVPSNVGNIAHLTGICLGIIMGIVFRKYVKKEERKNPIRIEENSMQRWEDYYLR